MFRRNSTKLTHHTLALLQMLFSVVLANTTPVLSKVLYEQGWSPQGLYFAVLLVMAIVLGMHELIALERGQRWGMTRKDVLGTALSTVISGIIEPIIFFTGLTYVTASESIILTSLLPFFVVLFGVLLLKERFTLQMGLGGIFLAFGVLALVWQDLIAFHVSIGVPLLLLSSFLGALTTIIHKKYIVHRHLDSIVLVRTGVSVLVIGLWLKFTDPSSLHMLSEPQHIWLFLGVPIVGFLIPFFLYFHSLRSVRTVEAGAVAAVGRVIGVVLAAGILGETLELRHAISVVSVACGILLINVPISRMRIVPSRLPFSGPLNK